MYLGFKKAQVSLATKAKTDKWDYIKLKNVYLPKLNINSLKADTITYLELGENSL